MNNISLKVGDLVCKKVPHLDKPIKIGVVIDTTNKGFFIHWTSVDNNYFMTKNDSIFAELNKSYLLGTHAYFYEQEHPFLQLLNSSYFDG